MKHTGIGFSFSLNFLFSSTALAFNLQLNIQETFFLALIAKEGNIRE
jgi:hypothetical protein